MNQGFYDWVMKWPSSSLNIQRVGRPTISPVSHVRVNVLSVMQNGLSVNGSKQLPARQMMSDQWSDIHGACGWRQE